MARWYVHSSAHAGAACRGSRARAGEAVRPHARSATAGRPAPRPDGRDRFPTDTRVVRSRFSAGWPSASWPSWFVGLRFIQRFDNAVAAWGYDHRSATSTSGLHALTDLGRLEIVVVLALAARARSRSSGGETAGRFSSCSRCSSAWRRSCSESRISSAAFGRRSTRRRHRSARRSRADTPRRRPRSTPPRALIVGRHVPRRARQDRGRGVGRGRGRRRGEPRPARPSLALGRDRRPLARLGLVRALQRRVRWTAAHPDRRRRRCGGRGRGARAPDSPSGTRRRARRGQAADRERSPSRSTPDPNRRQPSSTIRARPSGTAWLNRLNTREIRPGCKRSASIGFSAATSQCSA